MPPRRVTCLHGPWLRVQETPLELAVAVTASLISILWLSTQWGELSVFAIAVDLVFCLGGLCITAGRLSDGPHLESVGLVLLLGAYLFLVLRSLDRVHSVAELIGLTLNAAALAFGFGVRLIVVRKAIVARTWGARKLGTHRD